MAKLILHIGMHKTGSSAIQSALAAASGSGFIYPQLAGPPFKPHHTDALIELFSSARERLGEKKKYLGKTMSGTEEDKDRIERAAADAGDGPVILSSEGAYTFLSIDDISDLRRFAEKLFDSINIVAYVREPFSYISSNFQNKIKSSRLSSFNPKFPHYRCFEKFDEVFGRKNVHLWEYDRDSFPDGSVVEDFCSRLGIEAAASEEVNVRLSRPAVSAIYRLNRAVRGNQENRRAFNKARAAIVTDYPHEEWPKFRLSPKIVERLIEDNAADMDWIEQRMGRSLRARPERLKTDVASEDDLLQIKGRSLRQLREIGKTLPLPAKRFLKRALAA